MSRFAKLAILFALAGIMVVLNMFMLREPTPVTPIMPGAAGPAQLPKGDDGSFSITSDLALVQSFSRPLFSQDRRKFIPPAAKQKEKPSAAKVAKNANPAARPPIKLLGLSITRRASRALISSAGNMPFQWIEEGQTIDGWKVTEINPDRLVLKNGGQEYSIDLHAKAN